MLTMSACVASHWVQNIAPYQDPPPTGVNIGWQWGGCVLKKTCTNKNKFQSYCPGDFNILEQHTFYSVNNGVFGPILGDKATCVNNYIQHQEYKHQMDMRGIWAHNGEGILMAAADSHHMTVDANLPGSLA